MNKRMTEETELLPKYNQVVVLPCDLEKLKTDTEYRNRVKNDIARGAIYIESTPEKAYDYFELNYYPTGWFKRKLYITIFLKNGYRAEIYPIIAGVYSIKEDPHSPCCVIL